MEKSIPSKIVRQFVADVLFERRNKIMNDVDLLTEEELALHGVISEYTAELGWTACGTGVLADDVLDGQISLKEAIHEILSPDEAEAVKQRCIEWLGKNKEIER